MVEEVVHCTQRRTHTMMQTIEYRFELSTAPVADNQFPVRNHAGRKGVFSTPSQK